MTRSRFQLHLTTALVLMLAASALVWANTSSRLIGMRTAELEIPIPATVSMSETYGHGWPFTAISITHSMRALEWSMDDRTEPARAILSPNPPEIHWPLILANAAIALIILTVIAALTEFILRRKYPPT